MRSIAKLKAFVKSRQEETGDDWEIALAMVGQLEKELSHLYLKLPCDSEGEPIRPGDELAYNRVDKHGTVEVESVNELEFFLIEEWMEDGCVCRTTGCNPRSFHHVRTDELADALKDFAQNWMYTGGAKERDVLAKAWGAKVRELIASEISKETCSIIENESGPGYHCSECGNEIPDEWPFFAEQYGYDHCPKCGRTVAWDDSI